MSISQRIHTLSASQTARSNYLHSDRPAREKSVTVLVFDPDGTALGAWRDAGLPQFRRGVDGAEGLTLRLPRAYGALDEPGEPGSAGTLAWGNRVRVLVSDAQTDVAAEPPLTLGVWRLGEHAFEFSGAAVVVWSGTIEHWTPSVPAGVAVECLPLDRLLAQAPVLSYSATGDPLQIARDVLTAHAPGIAWDVRNPNTSGVSGSFAWTNATAAQIVEDCRAQCGPSWFTAVTPRGTLLFRDLDAATAAGTLAHHTLVAGVQATDVQLERDARPRAKRVIVTGAGGLTGDARASDYREADPRAVYIPASHLTDAGSCQRLAELELAARDRVVLSGRCTVWDTAYDVESIELGDAVRLIVDKPNDSPLMPWALGYGALAAAPLQTPGYLDYDQPLVVVGLTYAVHSVALELSTPRPNVSRQIAALMRDLAQLQRSI